MVVLLLGPSDRSPCPPLHPKGLGHPLGVLLLCPQGAWGPGGPLPLLLEHMLGSWDLCVFT